MSVLLINPPVKKVIEKRYDTPDYPSISLAYLASALKKNSIPFKVLDAKFDRLNLERTLSEIASSKPLILGFTAFTCDMSMVNRIALEVKKKMELLTIVGGCHVSPLPRETLEEFPALDFVLAGEGEESFPSFCEGVLHGKLDRENIGGLAYRSGGLIKLNAGTGFLKDIDSFSPPLWEAFAPGKEYLISTSRGCPYYCVFCSNPNGRTIRYRSVDSVLEEMRWLLENTPVERFTFTDEIFGVERRRSTELLKGMIRIGVPGKVDWITQTHVNVATLDMFKLMKEAGCASCGLGVETGDETILKDSNKKISFEKIFTVRNYAKKAGLPIEGYFILGHPNETKESIKATIKMAIKLNPEFPVIGIMAPYPGTEVRKMALQNKGGYRLRSDNWDDYNKQIGNALEFANISRRYVEVAQLAGYILVFLFNFRIMDLIKFVGKYYREGIFFMLNLIFKKGSKKI